MVEIHAQDDPVRNQRLLNTNFSCLELFENVPEILLSFKYGEAN